MGAPQRHTLIRKLAPRKERACTDKILICYKHTSGPEHRPCCTADVLTSRASVCLNGELAYGICCLCSLPQRCLMKDANRKVLMDLRQASQGL